MTVVLNYAFSAAVIAVLGVALWTGKAYYGGIPFRLFYVERASRPALFWLIVAFYVALAAMVFPFGSYAAENRVTAASIEAEVAARR